MAIGVITGFKSNSRESLDKRAGPYETVSTALLALSDLDRHVGLEVIIIANPIFDEANNYIGGHPRYYAFVGGIADVDLIEKIHGGTGLESIDEGNGIGWRLIGKDPEEYADIGFAAVDLSSAISPYTDRGASGMASFAVGVNTKASGVGSFAGGSKSEASADYAYAYGFNAIASGKYSFAVGEGTRADGIGEIVLGRFNAGISVSNILEIGAGTSDVDRKNALEVATTGKILAPLQYKAIIEAEPDDSKILITKEYLKESTGTGDMDKSVYDTNDNGIVDDSEKLGGHDPSYYATQTDLAGKLDDVTAGENITIDKTDPNNPIISSTIPIDGDKHFVFSQGVPGSVWSVIHNMDKYPSVVVVDSAGTVVMGKIEYTDKNNLILTFNAGFSGKAYLN